VYDQITVAVDAMGGDHGPGVIIEGALKAARRWGMKIVLVGDTETVQAALAEHDTADLSVSVEHASEVVGMHDSASDAIRKKKDSSIRIAFELVKSGRADAVVSAGNSGATMAAGMFVLKRIPGIERPAIATVVPNRSSHTLLLDAGGNVDCRPSHLQQFATMGDVYAREMMELTEPRVGLLSNGEEKGKGNDLTRETHALLEDAPFNYKGYIEGRDIFNGNVDVVVCDGFVGNVVLKVTEGLAEAIGQMLKSEIEKSFLSKIGYLLSRSAFKAFKKRIDYAEYGGAPLLGIRGVGMICHGGSNAKAIMNAINMASQAVQHNVHGKLAAKLQM
jgi:glycerol-3-phosphate acyltransferase PlsX